MKRFGTVEEYINHGGAWKESLLLLRDILSSTPLEETIKWGIPVYTLNNRNVAGFSAFKSWVAIWFFQGVFLSDPKKNLVNAQEGTTKGLRQWRFTSAEEINHNRDAVLKYLEEAIQNQKEGKEFKPDRNKPLEIPDELQKSFSKNPALKDCFESLTLSKKREYTEYISQAKREETRSQRLEKIIPMILEGIGLYDKYKSK